jgi:5S rRNA maturation endonuclease (ribonuclease M5)
MTTTYLDRAIAGELTELRAAASGRNNTLIRVAARLYEFVECGALSEDYVTDTLAGEASAIGLNRHEIRATLKSARKRAARIDESARHTLAEKCSGAPRASHYTAPPTAPENCDEPPQKWREAAAGFVFWTQERIGGALDYLAERGLTEQTITGAGLGYNPETREASRATWGMDADPDYGDTFWLPAGIVIPWYVGGRLWKVSIRRDVVKANQDRYKTLPGSANALYGVDSLQPGKPAILVEGPFDALAVRQVAGDLCGVVASGTSGARRIKWIGALALCSDVLVALDADDAGDTASAYWLDVLPNARRLRPYYADPAQMLQNGQDVRAWISSGLHSAVIPPWLDASTPLRRIVRDYWRGEVQAQSVALGRLRAMCAARGWSYEGVVEALGS